MEIEKFCIKSPYLYHLTDKSNVKSILDSKKLLSAKEISFAAFGSKAEAIRFLQTKRDAHEILKVGEISFKIRDQQPILLKVLDRSLTDGMTSQEFIELLNSRVFWWPSINRLVRHFNRYSNEKPAIIRVMTDEMLATNRNVQFCRLNSGATRCHPKYNGNAPTRGKDSFLSTANYNFPIASVAEVTFLKSCDLPSTVWVGNSPTGPWKRL